MLRWFVPTRADSTAVELKWDTWCSLFIAAAVVTWSAIAGKDLNWDQFNYHFYLGYEFFNNRLSRDFMAANVQSYFNPLPYLPFYWMVAHGWVSLVVASVLAAFHSANIVLCYRIGKMVATETRYAHLSGMLSAILAFISPIFLLEAGTSFADVTTAAFVLIGVLIVIRAADERRFGRAALIAGACIGAAAGLKLSNLIFGVACAFTVLACAGSLRDRVANLTWLAVGGLCGLILTHGYWSWRLYEEFGNPFFPLFNAIFASPDYPPIDHLHGRYLPETWLDVVLVPLRMLKLRSWIYVESVSPDVRFAALYVLIGFIFLRWIWVKVRPPTNADTNTLVPLTGASRALLIFFTTAYFLWVMTSGNGRYGIVVSILCGPALAFLLAHVGARLARPMAVACLFACVVVAAQLLQFQSAQLRWDAGPWTGSWYEVAVPPRLKQEPFLFVSIGSASNSFIAPFLAGSSAFTNPIGQISFDLDGPGGTRLKHLLSEYRGRTRMLALAPPRLDSTNLDDWTVSADRILMRLGLQVNPADCETIWLQYAPYDVGIDFDKAHPQPKHLVSCLTSNREVSAEDREQRKAIADTFTLIAKWCPRLFRPQYTVVERSSKGWFATYADSDSVLRVEQGNIMLEQPHTSVDVPLGTVEEWLTNHVTKNCSEIPTRLWRVYNFD